VTISKACALLALLAVSWCETARASGFATARFGGEHGNPTESNPTALYYNPAGIAWSEGTHLFADGTFALRRATWEHAQSAHDVPEPKGAEGANYGKATLLNAFGAPAFGATTKLEKLALGVGLFAPFGGRASWDRNDSFVGSAYPLAVDGVQRWHGYEGALSFVYLTAGAAYQLGPLSVGVSGNLVFSNVQSKQAKNVVLGDNDIDREARSALDVSGRHGSFGVGLLWQAIDGKLWIGASYQSAPGIGEMKLTGSLTNSSAAGAAVDPVDFTQKMPDVYRFGARFRPRSDVELRLFGDFTRWSRMVQQCIALADRGCGVKQDGSPAPETGTVINLYRGWRDTISFRVGASRWISKELELFGGLGFETSAIPDETLDPNLPDAHTIAASAGGRFEILSRLWLSVGYTHLQYLSRDNTGKSILDDPTVHPTTRRVDGGGKYTAWIGVLNLNVEMQL